MLETDIHEFPADGRILHALNYCGTCILSVDVEIEQVVPAILPQVFHQFVRFYLDRNRILPPDADRSRDKTGFPKLSAGPAVYDISPPYFQRCSFVSCDHFISPPAFDLLKYEQYRIAHA